MEGQQSGGERSKLTPYIPLIAGTILMFGAALAFGIFIGWLIWH
jgi:hypothetical protein